MAPETRVAILEGEVVWLANDRDEWKARGRASREQISILEAAIRDSQADHQSLERLYARTIDQVVRLEEQVTRLKLELEALYNARGILRPSKCMPGDESPSAYDLSAMSRNGRGGPKR